MDPTTNIINRPSLSHDKVKFCNIKYLKLKKCCEKIGRQYQQRKGKELTQSKLFKYILTPIQKIPYLYELNFIQDHHHHHNQSQYNLLKHSFHLKPTKSNLCTVCRLSLD